MLSIYFIGPCHKHALKAKYVTGYVFLLLIRHTTWVNQVIVRMLIQGAAKE